MSTSGSNSGSRRERERGERGRERERESGWRLLESKAPLPTTRHKERWNERWKEKERRGFGRTESLTGLLLAPFKTALKF